MFLQLDVFDKMQIRRGSARMWLDWQKKTWTIEKDPQQIWGRLAFKPKGTFELKSWGVIWLWDQFRNTAIFWDAPSNPIDSKHKSGGGRIFEPKDQNFKDCSIQWSVDYVASVNAAPDAGADAGSGELSALRKQILATLRQVLPCTYMDKNYQKIAPGLTKQGGSYTTCGSLPGFVTSELGGKPKGKGYDNYMKVRSLNGTFGVRTKGIKYNSWVQAEPGKRPKPGDIYALLTPGKTDKLNDGISHVGVIMNSTGEVWKTADMGQGGGYDGKIDVQRPYKEATCELAGEINQGGGYRVLAGWVDIDKYFST
jgi:hypothetical protein